MKKRRVNTIVGIFLSLMMMVSVFAMPMVYAINANKQSEMRENSVVLSNETRESAKIEDSIVPMSHGNSWSIINLIIIALMVSAAFFEAYKSKKSGNHAVRSITLFLVVISVLLFLIGTDFKGTPALFIDIKTLIFAALLILQANVIFKSRKLL